MHRRIKLVGAIVTLAALVAACSTAGRSGSESARRATSSSAGEAAGGAGAPSGASSKDARPTVLPAGAPLGVRRSIISTAQLQVRVAGVGRASERAIAIVEAAGGMLFSQQADLATTRDATLTFKVPPERFAFVLTQLGGLGRLLDRHVSTEDVTEQVVDLEGRLRSAEASADRLRALFANATDIGAIVAVEGELAKREAEVETLQGQLRVVNSQVDQATVTLSLTHTAAPVKEAGVSGFTGGLAAGWGAFVDVVAGALTALGAALPFLVVAGIVALGVAGVHRRRARRPAAAGPVGGVEGRP